MAERVTFGFGRRTGWMPTKDQVLYLEPEVKAICCKPGTECLLDDVMSVPDRVVIIVPEPVNVSLSILQHFVLSLYVLNIYIVS